MEVFISGSLLPLVSFLKPFVPTIVVIIVIIIITIVVIIIVVVVVVIIIIVVVVVIVIVITNIITYIIESDHGPLQKCMCFWDQTHLKQEAWVDRPSIFQVI